MPEGRVFALLPTMGGQTALNTALSRCARSARWSGTYEVELIGATADAIDKAEDRERCSSSRHDATIGLETCPKGAH